MFQKRELHQPRFDLKNGFKPSRFRSFIGGFYGIADDHEEMQVEISPGFFWENLTSGRSFFVHI